MPIVNGSTASVGVVAGGIDGAGEGNGVGEGRIMSVLTGIGEDNGGEKGGEACWWEAAFVEVTSFVVASIASFVVADVVSFDAASLVLIGIGDDVPIAEGLISEAVAEETIRMGAVADTVSCVS